MDLQTKTMGVVTIDPKQLINVPEGLFGFEKYTEYALLDSEQKPFLWLQSTTVKTLAFLVVDPFVFCSDYELDVDDEYLDKIGITSPADVLVMSIVTVPHDGSALTANLQGPIIINKRNNQCMQVIANDSRWKTKHDILGELKKQAAVC